PGDPPNERIIYTDGSCLNNGDEDARAGSGIWHAPDSECNKGYRLPRSIEQSNNTGEAAAVLWAVRNENPATNIIIKTDSTLVLDGLTKHLPHWEDRGWIRIANKKLMEAVATTLRCRKGATAFKKVKGHSGDQGNDGADTEAAKGVQKMNEDPLDITIPDSLKIHGAKLSTMTQALLYRGISEKNEEKAKARLGTTINLDIVRHAVKEICNTLPTDKRIWMSLKKKEISRNIRAYLWKAMHNAYKCGNYWNNIPGYEQRAWCQLCGTVESMEHILTECQASGQETLWKLAEELWLKKGHPWPKPKIGVQLGCG
ncbi:ribonuclease H-like domain-containing protein, partial [Infundibulicybe gibba]